MAADNEIKTIIVGDSSFNEMVKQSQTFFENIEKSAEAYAKMSDKDKNKNQDKVIEQLKAETKLLEQVNKQIVLNEKANKKDKETIEDLQTVLKQEVKTIKDAQEQSKNFPMSFLFP